MYNISFKSTTEQNNINSTNNGKRIARIALSTTVGCAASLAYYKYNKNYTGKKLWLSSLETGAALGLLTDIAGLIFEIPANVRKTNNPTKVSSKTINVEPYRNKEFFINLYSGQKQDSKEFSNYQRILMDKESCNKLFQDKEVLRASQEALLELNNKKIAEALRNNDSETIKQLELVNALLSKGLEDNNLSIQNTQVKNNNVSFGSIFNLFNDGNQNLKQRAEVIVNRYASSAAATAGLLANTGIGDTAALTVITKNMCKKVFRIYGCNGGYTAAITAVSVGAVVGTNLAAKGATVWPGAGNAINATITYTLHQLEGRALIEFLEENADSLDGLSDVDAVSKFAYRVKLGLNVIKNEKVKDILSKAIDKAFDFFL